MVLKLDTGRCALWDPTSLEEENKTFLTKAFGLVVWFSLWMWGPEFDFRNVTSRTSSYTKTYLIYFINASTTLNNVEPTSLKFCDMSLSIGDKIFFYESLDNVVPLTERPTLFISLMLLRLWIMLSQRPWSFVIWVCLLVIKSSFVSLVKMLFLLNKDLSYLFPKCFYGFE